MKKLPVFRSVGEVLSGVTRHYFQLLLAAWPALVPLSLMLALSIWVLVDSGLFSGFPSREFNDATMKILSAAFASHPFESLLMNLLWFLANAVAAVRWHRLVLLGEGTGASKISKVLQVEDGAYVGAILKSSVVVVLVGCLVFAAMVLLMKVPGFKEMQIPSVIAICIALFFVAVLALRLSLVLPDAAVGAGGRLRAVFKASSGNGLRLVATVVLLLVTVLMATFVVMFAAGVLVSMSAALGAVFQSTGIVIASAVLLACYLYFLMTQVTVLSVAYREIVGLPSGLEPDPA